MGLHDRLFILDAGVAVCQCGADMREREFDLYAVEDPWQRWFDVRDGVLRLHDGTEASPTHEPFDLSGVTHAYVNCDKCAGYAYGGEALNRFDLAFDKGRLVSATFVCRL